MAITIAFNMASAARYFIFPESVPTLRADFDTFIKVSNIGITIGKLNIAISAKLLLVREAIAEIIVNAEENPKLPSNSAAIKSG